MIQGRASYKKCCLLLTSSVYYPNKIRKLQELAMNTQLYDFSRDNICSNIKKAPWDLRTYPTLTENQISNI